MANCCKKITVLKVKRKASEDPLQVIRIEHPKAKKAKTDEKTVNEDGVLFHLFKSRIGEVNDNCILEEIKERLDSHQAPISPQTASDTSSFAKPGTKMQTLDPCNVTSKTSHLKSWKAPNGEEDDVINNGMLIEILDITKSSTETVQMDDTDVNEIYCNSIRMLRENLTISKDSAIQDEEFIYDLYYTHDPDFENQIVSINPSDGDLLDRTDNEIESEKREDSDSNDENHWKNDYPDEDHFYSSNDESSADDSCSKSSTDSDHNYHRPRDFVWQYNSSNTEDLYNFEAYDEDDEDY